MTSCPTTKLTHYQCQRFRIVMSSMTKTTFTVIQLLLLALSANSAGPNTQAPYAIGQSPFGLAIRPTTCSTYHSMGVQRGRTP
jgi:hypothetical protein